MTPPEDHKEANFRLAPKTKDAAAVALHQERASDHAPKVIASGRGRTAEQILEIAFALGIKVREDADLAQLLSVVNEESEIPVEAFTAVAEILVYLYQANGEAPPSGHLAESEEIGKPKNSVQELAELLTAKWRQASENENER